MHKILHLWDKLILGDHSYPLFIGISILRQLKATLLSSGFNECILLFSDLPDIVMESCVVESQKMYLSTPHSVSHRKHIIREPADVTPLDIDCVELADLQQETCPRISAADLLQLVADGMEQAVVVDLRTKPEFRKSHVLKSINIPFASTVLGDTKLEALKVPDLDRLVHGRIVIVVSNLHEHAVLVRALEAVLCNCLNGPLYSFFSVFQLSARLPGRARLHPTQWLRRVDRRMSEHTDGLVEGSWCVGITIYYCEDTILWINKYIYIF